MIKHRKKSWMLGALCAGLLCASCLGPNHATGRLFRWNAELDGKWGNEGAFLLLIPVYAVFSLGDVVIFNSIYWWTGDNPIAPPAGDGPTTFGA